MILPEDTVVAALECKHVIVQTLDEVKGKCCCWFTAHLTVMNDAC